MRPIPGDPDSEEIVAMFDLRDEEWWLTAGGEYMSAAGETMQAGGKAWQRVVMLQWPTRLNHGTEEKTIRLLISPEDAIGLGQVLLHTGNWLMELGLT